MVTVAGRSIRHRACGCLGRRPVLGALLTRRQRWLVIALALFVALTRLYAISHSMWDWDEALFASALHHYDVSQHHPHPPGFPLFFAFAKIARIFIHDDFRALRAISTIASLFMFPAIFALATRGRGMLTALT